MATYTELYSLKANPEKLAIVEVCIMVSAQEIMDNGAASPADRKWARQALYLPVGEAQKAWNYMLAKNKAAPLSAISNANESTLQPLVTAVVPALVAALAGT
jgi:hypothetical protein